MLLNLDKLCGAAICDHMPVRQCADPCNRAPLFRNGALTLAATVTVFLMGCAADEGAAMRDGALAQQQLEAGEIAAARESIKRAIAERDDIVALQLLRGRIELAANSQQSAFAAFRQALALDAGNVEALQGVAQLGLLAGHAEEAEDAANRLLALNPRDQIGLMSRGLLLLMRRNFDGALTTADQLLEFVPGHEPAIILKARVLLVQGKHDEARDAVAKTTAVRGSTAPTQMMLLEIARDQSDAATMMAQFERLRQTMPQDMDLRFDEADLRYKIGDVAGARALVGEMLRGNSLDASWARKFVALLAEYDQTPFSDGQLQDIARAGASSTIEELGTFLLDSGATRQLDTLLAAAPAGRFAGLRARAAAVTGRSAEASSLAQNVLASDRTNCQALLARASVQLQERHADAAVLTAQTAQARCPQIAGGWLLLARAYDAKNDPVGARRAFEDGIAAHPRQSFVPRAYTRWLLDHKQEDRALAVARKLTDSAPALVSGWALYRQVAVAAGDAGGVRDAESGMARARQLLGIDMAPGERPARGLLYARVKRV